MNALTGIGSQDGRSVYRFYHADGTTAGTVSVTQTAGKQGNKKKRLPYNFKQVSARILQSKTSESARQVLTYAQTQAAMLRRKIKSGEYDDSELESAVIHAEKMVQIARKRMKHLREEENIEKNSGSEFELEEMLEDPEETDVLDLTDNGLAAGDMQIRREEAEVLFEQMQERLNALMEDTSREMLESMGGLEELSEELLSDSSKDMAPEDFKLLKKKHRSDEMRDIIEADMKYLKAMFDRFAKEKAGLTGGGASLSLGGADVPVISVEMPVMTEGGNVDIQC